MLKGKVSLKDLVEGKSLLQDLTELALRNGPRIVFIEGDPTASLAALRVDLYVSSRAEKLKLGYYVDWQVDWINPKKKKAGLNKESGCENVACSDTSLLDLLFNDGSVLHNQEVTEIVNVFNRIFNLEMAYTEPELGITPGIIVADFVQPTGKEAKENIRLAAESIFEANLISYNYPVLLVGLMWPVPDQFKALCPWWKFVEPQFEDLKLLGLSDEQAEAVQGLSASEVLLALSSEKDPKRLREIKVGLLRNRGVSIYLPKTRPSDLGGRFEIKRRLFGADGIVPMAVKAVREGAEVDIPNRFLFMGNRGMGRSSFADAVAGHYSIASEILVTRFLSRYVGESEEKIRQFLQNVASMLPNPVAVVFKEIDLMGGEGDSGTSSVFQNLKAELISFLKEHPDVAFIATCTDPEAVGPDLLNIFPVRVPLLSLTDDEKYDILSVLFRKYSIGLDPDTVMRNITLIEGLSRPSEISDLVRYAAAIAWNDGVPVDINIMRRASQLVRPMPLTEKELQIERKVQVYAR